MGRDVAAQLAAQVFLGGQVEREAGDHGPGRRARREGGFGDLDQPAGAVDHHVLGFRPGSAGGGSLFGQPAAGAALGIGRQLPLLFDHRVAGKFHRVGIGLVAPRDRQVLAAQPDRVGDQVQGRMEVGDGLDRRVAGLGLPFDLARDVADVACPQDVEGFAAGASRASRSAQLEHPLAVGGGDGDLKRLAGLAKMAESAVERRGVAGLQRVLDVLQPVAPGDSEQAGERRRNGMGAVRAPAAPGIGRGGQKGFQPVHLRLQAGGAASVAAGKEVLPEGTRQTGSGKAGQGQRSESEGGGPCRRGHGRLSLSVCHVSIRQCRQSGPRRPLPEGVCVWSPALSRGGY